MLVQEIAVQQVKAGLEYRRKSTLPLPNLRFAAVYASMAFPMHSKQSILQSGGKSLYDTSGC